MDISGQVVSVTGRTINVKRGRNPGPKTVYDVKFSDGNDWTCWETETATKAMQLQGQAADLRGEVEQNGEYTNYKLLDIAPSGQLPPVVTGVAQPLSPPLVGNGAVALPIPMSTSSGGMSPERESKIVKQSCLSTAATLIGSLYSGAGPEAGEQATADLLALAKKLYAEVYGQANVATTPIEVANVVNATLGSEAVGVGAKNVPDW